MIKMLNTNLRRTKTQITSASGIMRKDAAGTPFEASEDVHQYDASA